MEEDTILRIEIKKQENEDFECNIDMSGCEINTLGMIEKSLVILNAAKKSISNNIERKYSFQIKSAEENAKGGFSCIDCKEYLHCTKLSFSRDCFVLAK